MIDLYHIVNVELLHDDFIIVLITHYYKLFGRCNKEFGLNIVNTCLKKSIPCILRSVFKECLFFNWIDLYGLFLNRQLFKRKLYIHVYGHE